MFFQEYQHTYTRCQISMQCAVHMPEQLPDLGSGVLGNHCASAEKMAGLRYSPQGGHMRRSLQMLTNSSNRKGSSLFGVAE